MIARRGFVAGSAAALLPLPAAADTRALLQGLMTRHRVPGASAAIIRNGEIVERVAVGADQDTLFQAASISKVVTGQVVLRLVDRGLTDLDSPINDLLASWKLPGTYPDRVTPRLLLCHRAGTTVAGFPGYAPGKALPTLHQILDGAPPANTPPVRSATPPGEALGYSGGGTMVLQQLAQDVSVVPFANLASDLVLGPVGMTRSSFAQPPAQSEKNVATAHDADGKPLAGGSRVYPELGAAGLWSTAADLARLAQSLAASWSGGGLLSRSLARTMADPVANGPSGLGIFIQPRATGVPFLYHYGVNAGFRSILLVVADGSFGVVLMTNGEGGKTLLPAFLEAMLKPAGYGDYDSSR